MKEYHHRFYFRSAIVFTMLALLGLATIPHLSVQVNPSPKSNNLHVNYSFQGASPEIVESEVTSKLEGVLSRMAFLKDISSTSREGGGSISLTFDKTADVEEVRFEIANIIRRMYGELPDGVSYPQVGYQSSYAEYETLLSYSFNSPMPKRDLEQWIQQNVLSELALMDGIRENQLSGLLREEILIATNYDRLRKLGWEENVIRQAIEKLNWELEMGNLHENDQIITDVVFIPHFGGDDDLSKLNDLPIGLYEGKTIRLGDVATIRKREQPSSYKYRINGNENVYLRVIADQGQNLIHLGKKVKAKMEALQVELREPVDIRLEYDRSLYLEQELKIITNRVLATLAILLVFVFLVKPQWRYFVMIISSLAVSLCISFIFYYIFDLEIHLYALAGITLSIGIVLDNIVVMAEHFSKNKNLKIFLSILAATVTTIATMLLIFFLEEDNRQQLGDFAQVFAINLGVSLFVALFFVPVFYRDYDRNKIKQTAYTRWRDRIFNRIGNGYFRFVKFGLKWRWVSIVLLVFAFGIPLFLLPDKYDFRREEETEFKLWYNKHIAESKLKTKWIPKTNKWIGGTFYQFSRKKDRFVFGNQRKERTQLYVRAKMPFGGTVDQLNIILQDFENYLKQVDGLDKFTTNINGPNNGNIVIEFTEEAEESGLPFVLKSELERKAVDEGAADFSIYGVGQGFSNELRGERLTDHLQLLGFNYEELQRLARLIKTRLEKHARIKQAYINSSRNWEVPSDEYFVTALDVDKTYGRDLNPYEIGRAWQQFNRDKGQAGYWNDEDNIIPIRMEVGNEDLDEIWNLEHFPLIQDSTKYFKISDFTTLKKEKGSQRIERRQQRYQLYVEYDFIGNYRLAQKVKEGEIDTISALLPLGYNIKDERGSYWSRRQAKDYSYLILGSILIIFMIGAILFNSLRQSLIPLLLIPVAFVGVFTTVAFFEVRFDQGGFAAFLLVGGLAVNAGYFIINDYNNLMKSGELSDFEAYRQAFQAKFGPIVLTILSTILGLLPFTIWGKHEPFWYPLAVCTIGGMVFSLIGVLIYFPLFFLRKKKAIDG